MIAVHILCHINNIMCKFLEFASYGELQGVVYQQRR